MIWLNTNYYTLSAVDRGSRFWGNDNYNGLVFYMARDVMILMRENPFRGPLAGVGPGNRDFFRP
jgi:hypothetical protein